MVVRQLSTLALSLLCISSSSALAATALPLTASDYAFLKQHFQLDSKGVAVGADSLKTLSSHTDFNNVSHTRMQQYYQGVPVVGAYAIVHQPSGKPLAGVNKTRVTGKLYHHLNADLGKRPANLADKSRAAMNTVLAKVAGERLTEKKSSLVVYIDKENVAHWAYKVSALVNYKHAIPARPSAIVDATTFKPFIEWNDMKTARHAAKAVGFGGNERVGKFQYGLDFDAIEITRDDAKNECYLESSDVKIVDMEGDYSSDGSPMTFKCTDAQLLADNTYWTGYNADGYDEINGAYSPSNDAAYAGFVIKHMYRDWYDLPVLVNSDGSLMQLEMRVHYGERYQNAYWDGRRMTFGDGGSYMYPLVSLGVGAHEISHGFTEQNSGLEYYGHSGGMNESFSDMAAQAAEFYSLGKSSWFIGERIMKEDSGMPVLRYMEKPSRDGRSIDSADDYYDGLDVHYSSGVYNRLFFLIATSDGWNTRKAFNVMVKANQDYWIPSATYESGACGVLSAATDYGYELTSIKTALNTVGIRANQCH